MTHSNGGMFSPALPAQPGIVGLSGGRRTIQLYRTVNADQLPDPLLPGELAVEISPAQNKLWIGDGSANRLLLSSHPGDTAAFPTAGGPFLPVAGGIVTGSLVVEGRLTAPNAFPPQTPDELVTAQWVSTAVTGHISDAPSDSILYGRRNQTWMRAVMNAGDTMTGALTLLDGSVTGRLYLFNEPLTDPEATSKRYVDGEITDTRTYVDDLIADLTVTIGDITITIDGGEYP